MSTQEYIISFYSIFIGVAGANIIVNWARILKDYPERKVHWSQLVWSLNFFLLLTWEWFIKREGYSISSPISLLLSLLNPILIYSISYLILPQSRKEDYSTFEKQKGKIAFINIVLAIYLYCGDGDFFYLNTARIQIALGGLLYVVLFFDRRKLVWDAASIVSIVFFFSIFSNLFGIGTTFSLSWISITLGIYSITQLFVYLRRGKRWVLGFTVAVLIILTVFLFYLNRTSLIITFYAKNQQSKTDSLEKVAGIRPYFKYLPDTWTPIIKKNMNSIWKSIGVKGMSYFSFGGPGYFSNYSSRSDIHSPNYQAWIGAYVIPGDSTLFRPKTDTTIDNSTIFLNTFVQLGQLDQKAWLNEFSVPIPNATILNTQIVDSLQIGNNRVPLYSMKFKSKSDITSKTSEMSNFIGVPDQSEWSKQVDEFHDVTFHCFVAFYYSKENSCIIMIYGAASEFLLKDGTIVDNSKKINTDLLKSIKSFHLIKL